jgi:hypothetical protein
MNPGQKGWLKEYLDFRREEYVNGNDSSGIKKGRHPDESLYSVVQPTGLMYGQPITTDEEKSSEAGSWGEKDKLKVLLAESFINSALLFQTEEIKNAEDFSEMILETTSGIGKFYNNIYPELSTSTRTFFGKKKSPLEIAEKILEKRINQNISTENDFWSNFFHNSLLFLDIFFFGQWIHTNSETTVTEFFKQEKDELRFCVVKVLAAAAHANGIVEKEERKLFEYFIKSSGLDQGKINEAYAFLENGVDLDEIILSSANSWILKKYFFELAILTVWSDKRVEDIEMTFLEQFRDKINLSEDDFDNSMVAIEGFVLQHWEELDALQSKKDYNAVSEQFIGRMSKIANKNHNRIAQQIRDNKELHDLLEKLNHEGLEDADRAELKRKLIGMLNSIPSFVIISLPSKFLTLPVLLKILSEDLTSDN